MTIYKYFPIFIPVFYLVFAVFNYYAGFAVLDRVSLTTPLLFIICAVLLCVGYVVALQHPPRRVSSYYPSSKVLRRIVFWGFVSTICSFILLISNRLVLGIDFSTVVEQTNQVREIQQGSALTKLAVIFGFFWFPSLASLLYMLNWKMRIHPVIWILLAIISVLTVTNSFLSVNRNPIVGLVVSLGFVYVMGRRLKVDRRFIARALVACTIGFVFLSLFYIYSRFLVENRALASERHGEIRAVSNARYDLSTEIFTDSDIRFLYTVSYYFSHQMPFVEAAVDYKGLVGYNATVVNPWLVTQLVPVFPDLYMAYLSSGPYRVNIESGIPHYTWNSIVGQFVSGFGWLLTPIVFLVIGYLMGLCMGAFWWRASYFGLLGIFFFFQCMAKPYMAFDFNWYCNGMVAFVFALFPLVKMGFVKSVEKRYRS